jgi:hypothetical protein
MPGFQQTLSNVSLNSLVDLYLSYEEAPSQAVTHISED